MRNTFALAMGIAAANAWGTRYGFALGDVENFIEGLIIGALEAEIPDVMTCITDGEKVVTDVEVAYADFKKESFDGVKDGIVELGTIVGDIATTVHACMGDVSAIENLIKMADNFKNPLSFAYHVGKDLLVHGVDIYHEINDAITQYDANNYYGFGEDVGKALAQVLVGAEEHDQKLLNHVNEMFLH